MRNVRNGRFLAWTACAGFANLRSQTRIRVTAERKVQDLERQIYDRGKELDLQKKGPETDISDINIRADKRN